LDVTICGDDENITLSNAICIEK